MSQCAQQKRPVPRGGTPRFCVCFRCQARRLRQCLGAIVEYFLLGQNAAPSLLQKLRQTLHGVSPDVLSGRVREVLDCDARDDLRRTTVPLLYLEARNDRLLSTSCKEDFSHIRPDVLFKSVPAPHLLLQREPQKAASIVITFLDNLPTGPDVRRNPKSEPVL